MRGSTRLRHSSTRASSKVLRREAPTPASKITQAIHKRTQHYRAVQSWFGKWDLVLTPTASRPPLKADHHALDPILVNGQMAGDMRQSWVSYLNLFDLTGHPALSIPCGFTAGGLPVGIQIVGRWRDEATVLAAAAAFEARRPWADAIPPNVPPR